MARCFGACLWKRKENDLASSRDNMRMVVLTEKYQDLFVPFIRSTLFGSVIYPRVVLATSRNFAEYSCTTLGFIMPGEV